MRHRSEGNTPVIQVEAGEDHPLSRGGETVRHAEEGGVEKLRFVDADHVGLLLHEPLDFLRVGDGDRLNRPGIVGADFPFFL